MTESRETTASKVSSYRTQTIEEKQINLLRKPRRVFVLKGGSIIDAQAECFQFDLNKLLSRYFVKKGGKAQHDNAAV